MGTDEYLGKIDNYQIIEKLGEGAYGCVYRAWDIEKERHVALKTLPPELAHNDNEMVRIRQNFVLVCELTHPSIALVRDIHKIGSVDDSISVKLDLCRGDFIIVMDYVEGVTLRTYTNRYRDCKLPIDDAIEIITQLAIALDYAHSEKVLHRDVKPSNVIVMNSGRVVLLDFGIALELRLSLNSLSKNPMPVSGTLPYMSPEQLAGRQQGKTTDQYGLAVLFYELISGEVPFHSVFLSNDRGLIKDTVLNESPMRLPQLSRRQNKAVFKALAKKADSRHRSCMQFAEFLADISKSQDIHHKYMFLLILASLLLPIVITIYTQRFYSTEFDPPDPVVVLTESPPTTETLTRPQKPFQDHLPITLISRSGGILPVITRNSSKSSSEIIWQSETSFFILFTWLNKSSNELVVTFNPEKSIKYYTPKNLDLDKQEKWELFFEASTIGLNETIEFSYGNPDSKQFILHAKVSSESWKSFAIEFPLSIETPFISPFKIRVLKKDVRKSFKLRLRDIGLRKKIILHNK